MSTHKNWKSFSNPDILYTTYLKSKKEYLHLQNSWKSMSTLLYNYQHLCIDCMSMFEPMYSNNENDLYYVYYIKLYLN